MTDTTDAPSVMEVTGDRFVAGAERIASSIEDRTRWTRLGVIAAVSTVFSIFVTLIVFVQIAAQCTGSDWAPCTAFNATDQQQRADRQALTALQLEGTEFILSGGTADAFLAGNSAAGADRITFLSPLDDKYSDWRVVWADGLDDTYGRADNEVIGTLASESFPGDAAAAFRAEAVPVIETGRPKVVTGENNGVQIVTRIVRVGPATVGFYTTINN